MFLEIFFGKVLKQITSWNIAEILIKKIISFVEEFPNDFLQELLDETPLKSSLILENFT